MGLPIGEPTCYAKEASTGHRCYVGQPDEDEAGTEGVRVYINTYRRSGPSRETADIEGGANNDSFTIKSDDSLEFRRWRTYLCIGYRTLQVYCRVLGQGLPRRSGLASKQDGL
jgi:hypothetical protein